MQKIKNSIIDKMIAAKLTSKEFDFVIYLSRFQNYKGCVDGVHYKELCQEMNMSYQGFYDVKQSLEEKGIISSEATEHGDYRITILENAFTDGEDIKAGYINTKHSMFFQKEFFGLKSGAKLLGTWLFKVCSAQKGCFRVGLEKFYGKEYLGKFGVTKRVMHGYLMSLKNAGLFAVTLKGGVYHIILKQHVIKKSDIQTEAERMRVHQTEAVLRRNRIKEAGTGKKELLELFKQYEAIAVRMGENLFELIDKAVHMSLLKKNEGEKWLKDKSINIKLIHLELKIQLNRKNENINTEIFKATENQTVEQKNETTITENCSYIIGYRNPMQGKKKGDRGYNAFNNFQQREYDNDMLERFLLFTEPCGC